MELFISHTCPYVLPVIEQLTALNVSFVVLNIDEDHIARERLRHIARGYLSVPTLLLEGGEALIETTATQVYQRFAHPQTSQSAPPIQPAYNALEAEIQRRSYALRDVSQQYRRWLWTGIFPLLNAGLLVFGVGFSLGAGQNPSVIIGLLLGLALISMLFRLPFLKSIHQALSRRFLVVGLLTYSFLTGMSGAAIVTYTKHHPSIIPLLLGLGVGVWLLVLLGMMTRTVWLPWYRHFQRWQRWCSIMGVILFMLLLALRMSQTNLFYHGIVACLALVLLATLILNSFQVALGVATKPAAQQSALLLYPLLALLLVFLIL